MYLKRQNQFKVLYKQFNTPYLLYSHVIAARDETIAMGGTVSLPRGLSLIQGWLGCTGDTSQGLDGGDL